MRLKTTLKSLLNTGTANKNAPSGLALFSPSPQGKQPVTYQPPSPEKLRAIQSELGYTQSQMAGIAGYLPTKTANDGTQVPDGAKWRKLTAPTGTASHRNMGYAHAYHLAAHLALDEKEQEKVLKKVNELLE